MSARKAKAARRAARASAGTAKTTGTGRVGKNAEECRAAAQERERIKERVAELRDVRAAGVVLGLAGTLRPR